MVRIRSLGAGADLLLEDGGDDRLVIGTGSGNDTVYSGETNEITGGDRPVLSGGQSSVVTYTGNESGTVVIGTDTVTFHEIEVVETGAGADTVNASAATTTVVADGGRTTTSPRRGARTRCRAGAATTR